MNRAVPNFPVPIGRAHFDLIRRGGQLAVEQTDPLLAKSDVKLEFLGTALAAIYEVGTCNRKCYGGPHLLESLCVRVYNLGISAFLLMERGFYDEALNLIRSVGEIGNFISLVAAEDGVVAQWVSADRRTRLREFSPYAVRMRLEKAGGIIIAPEDWYTTFCETYTHATPGITPNMHNEINLGWAGGVVQEAGFDAVVEELLKHLGTIALMASAFAKLDDHLKRLSQMVETLKPEQAKEG